MQVNKLPFQTQAATGFTHELVIDHEDFTSTGNTQTFTFDVPAGAAVGKAFHRLVEDFDSSDATLTSLLYIAGDDGGTSRYMTSTQVCADDTPVDYKVGALSNWYLYTSDNTVDIAFTGTASKDLSTLNAGKMRILIQVLDSADYAD